MVSQLVSHESEGSGSIDYNHFTEIPLSDGSSDSDVSELGLDAADIPLPGTPDEATTRAGEDVDNGSLVLHLAGESGPVNSLVLSQSQDSGLVDRHTSTDDTLIHGTYIPDDQSDFQLTSPYSPDVETPASVVEIARIVQRCSPKLITYPMKGSALVDHRPSTDDTSSDGTPGDQVSVPTTQVASTSRPSSPLVVAVPSPEDLDRERGAAPIDLELETIPRSDRPLIIQHTTVSPIAAFLLFVLLALLAYTCLPEAHVTDDTKIVYPDVERLLSHITMYMVRRGTVSEFTATLIFHCFLRLLTLVYLTFYSSRKWVQFLIYLIGVPYCVLWLYTVGATYIRLVRVVAKAWASGKVIFITVLEACVQLSMLFATTIGSIVAQVALAVFEMSLAGLFFGLVVFYVKVLAWDV